MFCPNCGTQNPDNAPNCSKCGATIQAGGAAPRFKGTMMMGPGGSPMPEAGGAAPPQAQGADPGLGATVAIDQMPDLMFPGSAAPAAGSPPPGGGFGGPPPGGGFGGPPPGGGFGGPPPGGGGFGGPPPGGGFGGPPPGGGGFGGPPPGGGGFGGPPPGGGGFGGPPPQGGPGGFGAPPQGGPGGFGAPPQGGFGGPLVPGGPGGGYGGPPQGMGPGGFRGETRNPVMVLVLGFLCCFYLLYVMWTMLNELKSYTRDEAFHPWWMFIPFLNYYFLWILVPAQVRKAKQMAGCRNPEPANIVLYILLGPFALATDLNQVWDPSSAG